jgi:hypothetical protein
MNLEKLDLVELNTREMMCIQGGGKIAKWFGYAMGYAAGKIEQATEWFEETMRDYGPVRV